MNSHSHDPVRDILKKYAKEQREFEKHWLWQKLKTTPQQFFEQLDQAIRQSGIPPEVWREKTRQAKQIIETRIREKYRMYTRSAQSLGAMRI